MTPLEFLNRRLKDLKMHDRINYIYLRNGRKNPVLGKRPAGPVDTTLAFQPGHPGSIPTLGYNNLWNLFFSLMLLILSVSSLYRIACGRIKHIYLDSIA